jgi:dTDP-glucose 4,6-dehydratase
MILNAIEGRELPVYGDGRQMRDWLHVSDHCRAIMAVIEGGEIGGTYLIGADNPRANWCSRFVGRWTPRSAAPTERQTN